MNSDIRYGCVVNIDCYIEDLVDEIKSIAEENNCVFINKYFDRFFLILTDNNRTNNPLMSGVECYRQIKEVTNDVFPIRVTDL